MLHNRGGGETATATAQLQQQLQALTRGMAHEILSITFQCWSWMVVKI